MQCVLVLLLEVVNRMQRTCVMSVDGTQRVGIVTRVCKLDAAHPCDVWDWTQRVMVLLLKFANRMQRIRIMSVDASG